MQLIKTNAVEPSVLIQKKFNTLIKIFKTNFRIVSYNNILICIYIYLTIYPSIYIFMF